MSDIAKTGRTILFVSHNMGAVASLCDRIVWIHQGTIRMVGTPNTVINRYVAETTPGLAGRLELRDIRRGDLCGDRLRITALTLNKGSPVAHGEPLTIRFEYEAYSDLEGVSFSIGFSTFGGQRLLTIDTDADGERRKVARGTGSAELLVDALPLCPGEFLLDIGSQSGDHYALDFLGGFANLSVSPGPKTPSHFTGGLVCVRLGAGTSWENGSTGEH